MCGATVTEAPRSAALLGLVDDAGCAIDKINFVCQMLLGDNVCLSDRGVSGLYYFLRDVAGTMAALVDALDVTGDHGHE